MEKNKFYTKLSVKEVFKEATLLYKENFILLVSIISISFIANIFLNSILGFLEFFTIISSLILVWIVMILNKVSYERYNGKVVNIKDSFIKYNYKFIKYLISLIILSIILLFSYILMKIIVTFISNILLLSFGYETNYYINLIILLSVLILPAYFYIVYFLAPIIQLLNEDKEIGSFKYSKKLVEGNMWRILFINLVTIFISFLPNVILKLSNNYIFLNTYVIASLIYLYQAFTIPFYSNINILIYHKLKRLKQNI